MICKNGMATKRRICDRKVGDIMSTDLTTVSRDTTIAELKELFERYDYNSFPVVDNEYLIGLITKLDFFKAFTSGLYVNRATFLRLFSERASNIMRTSIMHLHPDDRIDKAVDFMIEFRLRSIPVVKDGILVGMLSNRDIIRCLEVD